MKKLSLPLLVDTVITRRKGAKMTQAELAKRTGMNRSMLSKLETQEYTPSIAQLQALAVPKTKPQARQPKVHISPDPSPTRSPSPEPATSVYPSPYSSPSTTMSPQWTLSRRRWRSSITMNRRSRTNISRSF